MAGSVLLSRGSPDGFGFTGNDFQQYPCSTVRLATFLFPVLHGQNIEDETKGKFLLRQTQALPDCLDINFIRDMSNKTLCCLTTCIRKRLLC
jgi:hypothetical protein